MTDIETFEHEGVEVTIAFDEDPMDPREWDNIGTMLCNHPRYQLGDGEIDPGEHEDLKALLTWIKEEHGATVILPLYLLDHSGLSMSAGDAIDLDFSPDRNHFISDPGGWDTSMVGFIFDTREGVERCGTPESMEEALQAEVDTYDQYLRGDVYGYMVDGGDSCWGFFGLEEVREEAKAEAEFVARKRAQERCERNTAETAASVTYAWTPEPV